MYKGVNGRICKVCPLEAGQKEAVELALNGKKQADGVLMSAIAVARTLQPPLSATDISYHKTHCMGVTPRHRTAWGDLPRQPVPDLGMALIEAPRTELAVPLVWEPTSAGNMARGKLLLMAQRAERQLEETPTAAFYSTWLEIIKEIIRESEKPGGAGVDRMKSYADEVKREVTRTVTMKETVSTVTQPVITTPAVFSETDSI